MDEIHSAAEARPEDTAPAPPAKLTRTPSQTVGPFFGFALPWPDGALVVPQGTAGAMWLRGRVLDGAGDPVPDALIETWQADPDGRFPTAPTDTSFRGFGRCPTDPDGRYAILTLFPGVPPRGDGAPEAPYIAVAVFGRGMLKAARTRIYFEGQAANAADPALQAIADPERRATLIAQRTDDGYRFDIRLQGDRETVFFES